jgi:hypothetical protein
VLVTTSGVVGLDELLEELTAAGIEHGSIETYDNGVRLVSIPDPDGNLIAYAGLLPRPGDSDGVARTVTRPVATPEQRCRSLRCTEGSDEGEALVPDTRMRTA